MADLFVVWQFHEGSWSRMQGTPVSLHRAEQLRDAALASGAGVVYRILPAGQEPEGAP